MADSVVTIIMTDDRNQAVHMLMHLVAIMCAMLIVVVVLSRILALQCLRSKSLLFCYLL